eukprot:scaffold10488_cov67-Cyclotella_meneghiniana.AAC.16
MAKRRPLKGFDNDSSSSEEENDAFSSIGKKGKKRPLASTLSNDDTKDKISRQESNASNTSNNNESSALPAADTSSNKRHHHISAARKSKMDAMLFELQSSHQQPIDHHDNSTVDYGHIDDEAAYSYSYGRPNKLGSYVEPGQEHLTTNIFVGNLDPCTTEEELTDVFREYGEACV